jgi:hypothetical protein
MGTNYQDLHLFVLTQTLYIIVVKGCEPMLYQVINLRNFISKSLTSAEILDMDYDSEGRVIIIGKDKENYYLLASKDFVEIENITIIDP